jgi:hypothetical protein
MRKSGSEAGEPAGHRLQPSYFLLPALAGGEKARLGGESRREERLLSPISRTGLSTDRHGSDDDMSEGGFPPAFPPKLRHDRSRTRAEVRQVRLDQLKLTSLADQRPRRGWSRLRIVETSDILYFISFPKKNTYRSNKLINTLIRVCFRRYRYCHWRGWD